jgi:hypothetical protein
MATLATEIAIEGLVEGRGGRPAVTNNVIAITSTRQAIQPRMKATPFHGPRRLARTRMNAMIGSGSRVTASPRRARSATATWPEEYGLEAGRMWLHSNEAVSRGAIRQLRCVRF